MSSKEAIAAKNSRLNSYKDSKFSGLAKVTDPSKGSKIKVPRDVERDKYDKYVDMVKSKMEEEYDKRENRKFLTKGEDSDDLRPPKMKGNEEDSEGALPELLSEILIVKAMNLQISTNGINHHTEKYQISNIAPKRLVIRRGQEFTFSVNFSREYDASKDFIVVDFRCGPDPKEVKHTKFELPIKEAFDNPSEWAAKIDGSDGSTVTFTVHIPPTAVIGLWRLKINTGLQSNPNRFIVYELNQYIYVIFNPWCPDDQVYMEDDVLKGEYVLNDSGNIWVGEHERNVGRPWLFGQFDHAVLPCAFIVMERTGLDIPARSNAVAVVRALSAGVNSNDDDGILTGCWKAPYKYGTPPTAWTGSIGILDQFMKCGWMPIKYGQCWVFSGVTTTLCRALGIPCRSVTNFSSAHDTDSSLCIERYFDKKGNAVSYRDSIWNFHVWNDVWMTRPDLPDGYGGWQAIDSTPQERSEGIYQSGPASLKAIRNGEVGLMYDTPFIFAEVNADVVHWHEGENKKYVKGNVDAYHVGRSILTKSPHGGAENITDQYKPPDGSEEERLCFQRAFCNRDKPSRLIGSPSKEIKFNLKKINRVVFGQPFKISLEILNTGNEERRVDIILSCSTCTYTGALIDEIGRLPKTETIAAGSGLTMNLRIDVNDYLDKIDDDCAVKLFAIAKVLGTNQYYSDEDDFAFIKPELIIEAPESAALGEEFEINCTFSNPLPKFLTKCYFTIDAPGICRPKTTRFRDVSAKENVSFTEKLTASETGTFNYVVLFHSTELSDVSASKSITV